MLATDCISPSLFFSLYINNQPGTPRPRPYEAPTPGSGWASWGDTSVNTASTNVPSTPIGQPMTPDPASYLVGTPVGQPMTPGTPGYGGMELMSPVIGSSSTLPFSVPALHWKTFYSQDHIELNQVAYGSSILTHLIESLSKCFAGGEAQGSWLLPDVLVNVSRGGDEVSNAVVKEVLLVCAYIGYERM